MENLLDKPRRRALAWALALRPNALALPLPVQGGPVAHPPTTDALPAPGAGNLLSAGVGHVLYSSQVAHPFSEAQLVEMLEESRAYNQQHGITGLLCYRAGRFVQIMEGPAAEVKRLFAAIEQDKRLQQIRCLCAGASSHRWFAGWDMVFSNGQADEAEFYWLISYLEARQHQLVVPQIPITEPALLTLLLAFSTS